MKCILPLFLALTGILISSCKNNSAKKGTESSKQEATAVANNAENLITFKVNNTLVTSSGWNISRSAMNDMTVLNITSNMHQEQRTINININGDKAGSYKFLKGGAYNKTGYAYGSYFSNYTTEMMNPYHFEDGEFIIASIDTAKGFLDAEFSGTVKNEKGETLNITEGKVTRGKLRPGITKY